MYNNDYDIKMKRYVLNSSESNYKQFLLTDTEIFVKVKLITMTKTQMRNVFELFKSCKTSEELNMTKPKLLYTAGRLSGEAKNFLMNLSSIVMKAKNEIEVNDFKKYIETVLAYHKYYAKN